MKLNKNVTLSVFFLALFIQLVIITYNHATGYINVTGITNFLIRLLIGTTFSFVFGLLLVFLDLQIVNKLDKIFPLPEKIVARIPLEIIFAVVIGIIVGSLVTLVANTIMPYEDGLVKNIINNSLITSVINLIIMTVIEAVLWFKRNQETIYKAEKLEKENSQIRFQTFKSQLNPHFLFNSLNVLSSLIRKDQDKSQNFIDEFSSVYRYILDVIEKPVVELREELEFAKSFLYLQKIRFDDSVNVEINVDASKLVCFVPPLAVQTLLENAFKHNRCSAENPLNIKIYNADNYLVIVNNLRPKLGQADSKGVGQNNLNKRYELLGEKSPEFSVTEKEYISKIPLINPE